MNYGLFCIQNRNKNNNNEKFDSNQCGAYDHRFDFVSFTSSIVCKLTDDEVAIFEYYSQWFSTFDLLRLFSLMPVSIMILLSRCKLFIVQINERKQRVREHFLSAASVSPMNIMGKLTRLYGIADTINTNQSTIYTKTLNKHRVHVVDE